MEYSARHNGTKFDSTKLIAQTRNGPLVEKAEQKQLPISCLNIYLLTEQKQFSKK